MGENPLSREDAKRGRAEFVKQCGFCHGPNADGAVHGPNLIRSVLVRSDKDGDRIGPVIREGRPAKGMPAFSLTQAQLSDIVVFLHASVAASDFAGNNGPSKDTALKLLLTGDAGKGKVYFDGAGGCSGCHSVTGDLAGIAGKFAPIDLQARFLYPEGKPTRVTVSQPSKADVSGELVHRDAFTITLRDSDGWTRTWPVNEVTVKIDDPLAAHKALLDKLTNADVHNVFAYLETLKK